MNKVILMGRLTKDADVRYTQEGTSIARYTLAVDRVGKDKSADFINCIAFGKQAEFAEKYLKQGTKTLMSGRIQTGSYTNKDGNKVYTTDVVAEQQEFAESKRNDEKSTNTSSNVSDGFMSVVDITEGDELPWDQV